MVNSINRRRRKLKMKREELAIEAQVSLSTIYRAEGGHDMLPAIRQAIEDALARREEAAKQ